MRACLGTALAFAGLLGAGAGLRAADVAINDLGAPSAPAFTLLGVAPSSIERPANPKALAFDVAGAAAGGTLPQNYALECTPYWMLDHPYETVAGTAAEPWYRTALETANVSVAIANLSGTAASGLTSTAMGLGVSLNLRDGRLNGAAVQAENAVLALLDKRLDAVSDADKDALDAQIKQAVGKFQGLDEERVGLLAQVAAGAGIATDNGKFRQDGLWSTVDYRTENALLDNIVLVRYLRNEEDSQSDSVDLGAKFNVQKGDLGIAAEYLSRWYGGSDTWRADGQAQYRLAGDIYVTLIVGRDFAAPGTSAGGMISQMGLKFGVSPTAVLPE